MSLITDILGKARPTDISNADYILLDDIFSYNAIWLQNAIELFKIPVLSEYELTKNIPLPLIGLAYRPIGEIELINYEWAQYPYLSKQVITNAGIKQPTRFAVDVYSVFKGGNILSGGNTVALNLLKISTIVSLLNQYVAKGGLFTILTLYGFITDCVLEKITGISDGEMVDGTHLRFNFLKPNIDTIAKIPKELTDIISRINVGGQAKVTGVTTQ